MKRDDAVRIVPDRTQRDPNKRAVRKRAEALAQARGGRPADREVCAEAQLRAAESARPKRGRQTRDRAP